MTRFISWLLVLALLGGFAVVVSYELRARADAGKGLPAFSVYSEDRDGLAEAGRLLHKLGWDPVALTRPIQQTQHRGLLVLAEPQGHAFFPGEEPDLSEIDVRFLLAWVEQGNTLLFCCDRITNLHRQLGLGLTRDERATEDLVAVDLGASAYLDTIERLVVEGRNTIDGAAGLPLWWTGKEPGAVLVRHGKGRVFVVADATLFTLRGLQREDNSVFLYNVVRRHARDGRVYFDEYHHGLHSGGGFWGYLAHYHLQWTLLPLLLVIGVTAWRVGLRLGPAVPTPPATGADAVDYASALARIYEGAGARRLLGRILARGFLAALTKQVHLRRAALPAEILAAWQERYPKDSTQRLQGLLRGLADLHKGEVSDRQLLTWTRAFDEFQKEVASG